MGRAMCACIVQRNDDRRPCAFIVSYGLSTAGRHPSLRWHFSQHANASHLDIVEIKVFYFEVYPDGRDERRREAIVRVSHEQARFAYTRVPEHEQFDVDVVRILLAATAARRLKFGSHG